jgi:monothiol glutaredoxin
MSNPVHEQIDKDVKSHKIVVYMKGTPDQPMCGFSAATVGVLKQLNVPFAFQNVLEDEAVRQGIKEYSNWPTIPQLYVKGEFVGGNDIVQDLFQSGELQKMVQD